MALNIIDRGLHSLIMRGKIIMFGKKKDKNSEFSPDIMAFKNALEEVRFTPEVEHDAELINMFDEAIDKAEKGEAVQTIYGRLSYQITQYIASFQST